jgi:hypothetical protein
VVLSPEACSAERKLSICVDLPEPSTPEKEMSKGELAAL